MRSVRSTRESEEVAESPPIFIHPAHSNTPARGTLAMAYLDGTYMTAEEERNWIEACTGETVDNAKLYAIELPWSNTAHGFRSHPPSSALPPRPTVEKYVDVYCSSFQSRVFPVISKTLFTETLDLAYGTEDAFGAESAKSCVYALLSVVFLFGLNDNLVEAHDCEAYALAAQNSMPSLIQEMTLSGLQSIIMLIQHQYFLGDLQAAAVSVSIASRLLFKLGAHVASPSDSHYHKSVPEHHLRDLFWLCYSFDKDICLRTGQPPCINDTHCDLTLPVDYAQMQDANLQRETVSNTDDTVPLFPFDLRLSMIKSDVYQALYSANTARKSAPDILSSIRSLDQELEQWRLSLHPDIRPPLSFNQETPVSSGLNTQAIMLRLAYYHCVAIIHQAIERCRGGQPREIVSSTMLVNGANQSTLSFLETALPVLAGECFWVAIFYAVTAVLALFRNVLKNPLGPRLMTTLRGVPKLMQKFPIRTPTLSVIIHMQFLNNFTTELVRLGACAVSKARQDARGP
ncbi:transcription factor domain-containing protein [Aspergillus homomorphus CBS 101889]|uniref:Xylanolytic transcriptional activator regulatory domain-containing protein n=1 Tax=Aspergillus homomorphus (strain CBS 101889) TaxID=1450537 RepID=A0A395HLW1_ASPHC|nr:hypothetical protein BO97DRAFT_201444 [Aspergillus homomorphus CBS 101889]RAL08596.1 hypothetical protein BO97DRAFT_201444 [Aspergillus homomorphus CBS 101889]